MVFKSVVRRWICRFNTWITKTLHLLWLIFRPCKFHRSICSWLWSMCGWCIKPQAAQSSSSGSAYTIACAYTGKRKSEVDSCNVIILSNYNYYTVDERDFLGHFLWHMCTWHGRVTQVGFIPQNSETSTNQILVVLLKQASSTGFRES